VAAALFNWSGLYVGLQAGYGWGTSNHRQGTAQTDDFTMSGFVGGGTLGWNWQAPGSALVWGIETDISWSNIHGSRPIGLTGGFFCFTGPCETFVKWFGTVRGRIGVAFDRSLLYATGGLAYGNLFAQITPDPTFTGGETKAGWTAGFGWEWAFAPNWSVKAEYLYVDFGRFVYGTSPPPPTALAQFSVFRGGVNWHF
jgi:outer membrane immunogenic protein